VFDVLGLRVRRNLLCLLGFVVLYRLLMSPVPVIGYGQELLSARRRWR
jgi:poly-beta-1,6-N-acetyl-D-glucosamine synthase